MKKQRRKRTRETGIFAPSMPKKSTAERVRAYYAKADELKSRMVEYLWKFSISDCGKEGCELYDVPPADKPACFSRWIGGEIDPEHEIEQALALYLKLEMIRRVNKQLLKTPQAKAFEILRQQAEVTIESYYPFNAIDYILGSDTLLPICETLEESLGADFEFESEQNHLFNHSMNVSVMLEDISNYYSQIPPAKLFSKHLQLSKDLCYTPPIF